MVEDDRTYFQQRAETELQRAQDATDPAVVAIHYQLSEAYLAKIWPAVSMVPVSRTPASPDVRP